MIPSSKCGSTAAALSVLSLQLDGRAVPLQIRCILSLPPLPLLSQPTSHPTPNKPTRGPSYKPRSTAAAPSVQSYQLGGRAVPRQIQCPPHSPPSTLSLSPHPTPPGIPHTSAAADPGHLRALRHGRGGDDRPQGAGVCHGGPRLPLRPPQEPPWHQPRARGPHLRHRWRRHGDVEAENVWTRVGGFRPEI
jgi:hypothetical protein